MKKILLVEDDQFLVRVYKLKLEKFGFNVIYMEDGRGVVQTVRTEKPNLIVLDILLPNKGGMEVLKELKENSETKDVPVVVLSQLSMEEDIEKSKSAGAVDHLVKSKMSFNEVAEQVKKLLME